MMFLSSSHQAHPFGLSGEFFTDIGFTGLLNHLWGDPQIDYLRTDFIAGPNLAAEFDFVNSGQEKKGVASQNTKLP